MRLPVMESVVERRLLINYRVDPEVAAAMLPAPLAPQIVNGWAVAGICMIRLGSLRPHGLPAWTGLTNENAAHRFAVRWPDGNEVRTGVYVPTRHTSSRVNAIAGDRLFPGRQVRARFDVAESAGSVAVAFATSDGGCRVDAAVDLTDQLESPLFPSATHASEFIRSSPTGFSPGGRAATLEGVQLRTDVWTVEPARIRHVHSSVFDDRAAFPDGSIQLDSALVMRNIPAQWHATGPIPTRSLAPV
jgi:Uncharacterized conserved protein (COG2071)